MQLFYMDESGTSFGDRRSPYFILAAIGIPAQRWSALDNAITMLKHRLIPYAKAEDFALKGRDLRRGEKLFKSLSWQERVEAFNDIAQAITALPCSIGASSMHTGS